MNPYERFDKDIPEEHREDVLTMMTEAAHNDDSHDCITILNRDQIDAINVCVEGILKFEDEEYTFILESGNWNGTVLMDWNTAAEFVYHQPTRWALAPDPDIILRTADPALLLAKWDAMLSQPDTAAIPGKYSYDRMMQPGHVVEKHWKAEAAKHGMVLVSQEHADEIRASLK